jgi:Ca2+-binding RTX toxin-like protein
MLTAVKLVERNEERNEGVRRTTLLVAMVAGLLVLASGVALAVNIVGNNGPNLLIGTQQADNIAGAAGNDTINARGGNDRAFGDSGTDELNGGEGADFLNVADGAGGDSLNGGPGFDTCVRDAGDPVFINCNSVITVP